jgi:hypothetical protein
MFDQGRREAPLVLCYGVNRKLSGLTGISKGDRFTLKGTS